MLRRFTLIILLVFSTLSGCVSRQPVFDVPKVQPPPRVIQKVEVALVLGAGGSRGLAHLGILEVFEEEGIPVDLIVGASAGSLAGALYADNPSAKAVKEKILYLKKKDLLDPSFPSVLMFPLKATGYIQGKKMEQFLRRELMTQDIEKLKVPLVIVATDLNTNEGIGLSSGPIIPAIRASTAVPGAFSPVELYGKMLIDGGVSDPVPVNIARRYKPKMIIAVDISTPPSLVPPASTFQLLYRSIHISYYGLSKLQSRSADFYLHPNLEGHGMFEDHRNEELYEKGKYVARAALKQLKEALFKRGIALRK